MTNDFNNVFCALVSQLLKTSAMQRSVTKRARMLSEIRRGGRSARPNPVNPAISGITKEQLLSRWFQHEKQRGFIQRANDRRWCRQWQCPFRFNLARFSGQHNGCYRAILNTRLFFSLGTSSNSPASFILHFSSTLIDARWEGLTIAKISFLCSVCSPK
jgi:hypothetical protein